MIENHLSGKHFAYKASKRSRCVVCSKQISPTTGRRKDVTIALSVMCSFAFWYLLHVIPHMFHCIVIVLMCLPYCMCVYFSQSVCKIYQLLRGGVQN